MTALVLDAEALNVLASGARGEARVRAALTAAVNRVGSVHLADAHTVAAAISHGGGVILTGDIEDIQQLAAPHGAVTVATIRPQS